jgi:NADH dehydrogenase
MAEVIKNAPAVPVPGKGKTKFQPLYVKDWVRCFLSIMEDPKPARRTYELGGPEHLTFNEITKIYMDVLGLHKRIIHLPVSLVKAGVRLAFLARAVGIKGLPPVSREQIELLDEDNITGEDIIRKTFGFEPARTREALGEFLKLSEMPSKKA